MPVRCLVLDVPLLLLMIAVNTCSTSACSVGDDHCDGNVAWVCNGGGDKGPLRWEFHPCEDNTTCIKGTCFTDPLIPCNTSEIGQWTCSADQRYVGLCSHAGYWGWNTSHPCELTRQETCQKATVIQDGQSLVLAQCVLTPLSSCRPDFPNPGCLDTAVTDCTPIGYRARVRDCAVEGMICQDGACGMAL